MTQTFRVSLIHANIRKIHSSPIFYKRIAEHNQRKQRLKVFPFHNVKSPSDLPSEKLILKNDDSHSILDTRKAKTVYEKLSTLYLGEKNLWHHIVKIPMQNPTQSFKLAKYLTRSSVVDVEDFPNKISDEKKLMLINKFLIDLPQDNSNSNLFIQEVMSKIWSLNQTLSNHPQNHYQESFNSKLETFYKFFHGHNFVRSKHLSEYEPLRPDPWIDKDMDETIVDKDGIMRLQIKSSVDYMIRMKYPLNEILKSDEKKFDDTILFHKFHPQHLKLEAFDCIRHTNLPYSFVANKNEMARNVAGFWNDSPYFPGDECEFGLLGCVDVCSSWTETLKEISSNLLSAKEKENHREDFILSNALMTLYTWNHSTAINQGFILPDELKYPLTSQLILVDMEKNQIRLVIHQLNTITAQSKAVAAQVLNNEYPSNLLAVGVPVKFLNSSDSIKDGISNEAFNLITTCMSREYKNIDINELRPYLQSCNKEDIRYIGQSSESSGDSSAQKMSVNLTKDELEAIKVLERKRLESMELPKEKYPKSSHVHEVYLFNKDEEFHNLVENISAEMKQFGSPYLNFPQKKMEEIREKKLKLKLKQAVEKVEKPPPRKI